ncbi:MAG: TonB-dependent receptor [Acidobacteriia bacterium]|nr:TonB-dependent receptor [Terriglobia bacterium]
MAFAQGVGASGDLTGTVTDPSGAAVAGATVVVSNAAQGMRRTAVTDSEGAYRVAGLSPAKYDVSVEHAGFQAEVQSGIVVNVGQVLIVDFQLRLAGVAAKVGVTSELPVVETERGHLADTITEQYITDLPISRRDYLTFTLLMPGVSDSTRQAANQEFRVKQTPQSGLSFYGSNGRGNSVTVDGGEANDDSGGVRLTLSQDAVQEFQINRSNYSAEQGSSSGASINIVSKAGSNQVHGSAYGFFRNDALDAGNPFAYSQALQPSQVFNPAQPDSQGQPVKNALDRQQFGGTVGFPIKKDKTFLFAAFEGLRQDAQNAVPLLTNTNIFRPQSDATNNQAAIISGLAGLAGNPPVPCLTGQPALPAATCAVILTNILTINPVTSQRNAYLVNQFENNGGVFPYGTRTYLGSGRLDHRFSDQDQVHVRYSFGHGREENPDVQSLTGFSRGSAVRTYDHTLQGAWFHLFSAKTQNELRLQGNYNELNVVPNVTGQVGLDIPGYASLGTNIFLPSRTIMRRTEFADNFTMIRGHHTMKMGLYVLERGNHTESDTFFPGRFVFGALPGGILSPCLQVPAACGLTGVQAATINSLQSVSLGLPQFYQQGFGNPVYNFSRPLTAAYWQDSWAVRPNFTLNFGVRYELDSQSGSLHTEKDNFGPRVSFAWDPFKNHKTVVRGGYGIFYSPVYAQIADVVQTLGNVNGVRQIANLLVPLTGAPGNPALTSAAIFQTLFAQGRVQCTAPAPGDVACIRPSDLTQFGITVSNSSPLPPLTVLFSGQPGYQNPYSQQAELGVEREIAPGLSVSASYVYVHTLRLPVAIDTNLLPAPTTSVVLANGATATYRNWKAASCTATPTSCFVNPLILQNNVYSSAAKALYQGGLLEVKKRFSDHFTLLVNYTYSKALDNSTDFNSDYSPVDQTNLAAERSVSSFDERHKLVFAAVLESPWKGGSGANVGERIFSGFQLSPVFRYNSGHPFTLLAGSDVNGDRHSTNDRPIGAGRNTGLGPDFWTFDMRVSRQFHLGEKVNLRLLAEGFNLLNRTNYGSVNNVVGANYGLLAGFTSFNVSGTSAVSPSQPLGYTSALAKREIQFGVRLDF